jgi:hypothetical protein
VANYAAFRAIRDTLPSDFYLYDPPSGLYLPTAIRCRESRKEQDNLLPRMDDCAECIRLWREYAAATKEHIALEGKLRIAEIARDSARVTALSPQVEGAGVKRTAARNGIKAHEEDAHPSSGAAEA